MIETVGVGQAETEVADVADTVAVVVQPGSGDVLQFLKSGIMEIPTCSSSPRPTSARSRMRTRRDLSAALRSLGSRTRACWLSPRSRRRERIEELVAALDEHRARSTSTSAACDTARRPRLTDFVVEHGEQGLQGARRSSRRRAPARRAGPGDWLVPALVTALEQQRA